MTNYDKIATAFAAGKPILKGWVQRTSQGVRRMSLVGDTLMSYERFDLAWRSSTSGILVVNGDQGPSMTTRKQQTIVRDAVRRADPQQRVAIVPFSALRAARVGLDEGFGLIDVGADTSVERWVLHSGPPPSAAEIRDLRYHGLRLRADGRWERKRTVHFLGEVLFRSYGNYYLSGLDRNDDPSRRNFYLTRLYVNGRTPPRTVEEALASLRPPQVPEDALRQGEYFFVPAPSVKPQAKAVLKQQPILTEHSDVMVEMRKGYWNAGFRRENRHVATRMYLNGSVYVLGMVRDAEHTHLKLGDGKTWYRVVRNTALGGWNATGDVD
jgi:hypothetical protein